MLVLLRHVKASVSLTAPGVGSRCDLALACGGQHDPCFQDEWPRFAQKTSCSLDAVFSDVLALSLAAWHGEVRNVSNLARKLVVTRSWSLHLPATSDVRSLTRSKAELRCFGFECLSVVVVVSRAWNVQSGLSQVALELEAHGELGARLLGEGLARVVRAAARHIQS